MGEAIQDWTAGFDWTRFVPGPPVTALARLTGRTTGEVASAFHGVIRAGEVDVLDLAKPEGLEQLLTFARRRLEGS